jgi:hypothetical protein
MIQKVAHMGIRLAAATDAHPLTTAGVSVVGSIIAVLQSAQEVVGTLIALVSSLAALVAAIMALRGAFKEKDKDNNQ